ncbi:tripartite tricarboxylate transporter substrate binding protein [Acidovorax sp. MR-S7]|uniref:Bug family tripartite tricarboxylate transporter substrate binding protein n=1 Tax=Acidovorax sp. MR-S7 TaxID=1268622 RepID=UPI00039C2B40|nr:tripartite tricarboxylate transporter substrate binding protein [Acidovorax sp. MR-S7]GAD24575.1 hypothetical protein AVS7_04335 [Acidovorax sp. MR-S7]
MNIPQSIRALAAAAAFLISGACAADTWPSRPVKVLVGFPAGQATDALARMISQDLSQALGQPFVVENRPGQSGSIALAALAAAPADGYTMGVVAPAALVMNPHLYKRVSYDPLKDFIPVASVVEFPLALVANAKAPYNTVEELVTYAKAHPNVVNFASVGNATMSHLTMERFMHHYGIKMTHVPYQGSSKSIPDLMAGVVSVSFDTVTVVRPHLGKDLKALAVASREETELLPGVSTLATEARGNIVASPWVGVIFPKGVAPSIATKVEKLLEASFKNQDARTAATQSLGALIRFNNGQEFSNMIQADSMMWKGTISRVGAKLD